MSEKDRARGVYIIGRTGMGKTVLLENLIVQDMERGDGLCVLDPHRDMIDHVLARLPRWRENDVILLDLRESGYPFGLNLFACDDPDDAETVAHTADHAVQVFKKVWGVGDDRSWGPRLEDLLGNVAYTLIANPGMTLAEMPRVLSDDAFRERLVAKVENITVADFWTYEYDPLANREQRELRASTLNKVRAFLRDPLLLNIVGQAETTIPFREILDDGRILLVKLDRRLEALTTLVGAMLVGRIADAAFSREEGARRPFSLYADEYQRFATPDFAVLLTEARKYGIRTTLAHQFRDQLDRENRGATLNASTIVIFRVTPQDATELAGVFDATPPEPQLTDRVTGYRPKLIVVQDVVSHLMHKGHEDRRVNELFAEHLYGFFVPPRLDLQALYSAHRFPSQSVGEKGYHVFWIAGWYNTTISGNNVKPLLNRHLVLVMEQRGLIPGTKVVTESLVELFVLLRAVIGFAEHEERRKNEHVSSYWFANSPTTMSFPKPLAEDSVAAVRRVLVAYDEKDPLAIQQALDGFTAVRNAYWQSEIAHVASWRKETPLDADEDERKGFPLVSEFAYARAKMLAPDARMPDRVRLAEQEFRQIKSERDLHVNRFRQVVAAAEDYGGTLARERALFETEKLAGWADFMIELSQRLSDSPAFIESGQFEEIYEYEQERSYADVSNQIANELATLPAFSARCKVGTGEYTIRPEWVEPEGYDPALMDGIRTRNRLEGIARERSFVEDEIRRRRQRDDENGTGQSPPLPPPQQPPMPPIQGREPV